MDYDKARRLTLMQKQELKKKREIDEDYATSVRTATSDADETYLYDNLGVPQTVHLFYSYRF